MAYAREPVKVPRQFVVIATTNHGTYLRDQTGGRRFWPVTVRKIDVELLRAERDQLWAEAAVMEARGDSTHLDPSLWAAAGVEQEARFVVDPWEEAIMDALGSNEGDVTTHEIWRIVGMQLDRRTQTDSERVGTVMRRLGFRSLTFRNRSKLVVRGWRRGSTAGSILPEGPL
jgi:predicted P-loop ATPase